MLVLAELAELSKLFVFFDSLVKILQFSFWSYKLRRKKNGCLHVHLFCKNLAS